MELTVELTDYCENECIHCSSNAGKDRKTFLDVDKLIDVVKMVHPSKIILSGGEPFYHPAIGQIVLYLKSRNIRLAVDTCGRFPFQETCLYFPYIDEFYISFHLLDNEKITKTPFEGKPFNLINFLKVVCKKNDIWVNSPVFCEQQVIDLPLACYRYQVAVHLVRLLNRGRGKNIEVLPSNKQLDIANQIIAQLDPSRADKSMPAFLKLEGYDDDVYNGKLKKKIIDVLSDIYPRCKISHSLLEKSCRASEKRTLLPDGRLIGCVAGKEKNEKFDVFKICN